MTAADGPRGLLRPAAPNEEPFVSYSQNAEDVRLWRVLHDVGAGFYVDVGAADPTEYSVTKLFYDRGWSGINIEPGPSFSVLAAARPRDINLNVAVASAAGMREFWISSPHSGLSTIAAEPDVEHLPDGFRYERTDVRVRTASAILDEHAAGRTIDFMSIDVEGAEAEVISSIDLDRHRPRVMVVEAVAPLTHEPVHERWEGSLLGSGYLFAAFDGINRFYVEEAETSLVPALAYPMSPLDRYATAAEHSLAERIAGLRREVDGLAEQAERRSTAERRLEEAERLVEQYRIQLAQLYASRTWRAGRMVAALAAPRATARRIARRARPTPPAAARRHLSAVDALAAAVEPGQAWHYDRRGSAPRHVGDRRLESLSDRFEHLALADAEALADEAELLAWADEGALRTRRLTWEERQALAEAAAVARVLAGRSSDTAPTASGDGLVVVDARSLQDPLYARRGVGLHAAAVVRAAKAVLGEHRLALLVAPDLPDVPPELESLADVVARSIYQLRDEPLALFVELSPMTHSAIPFAWCRARGCATAAVVFDFIPQAHPAAYLHTAADVLAQRARTKALALYDLLLPISEATADECRRILGPHVVTSVARVADPLAGVQAVVDDVPAEAFALVPAGGDPRKNPAAVVAALRLHLESGAAKLKLVVTGGLTPPQHAALLDLAASLGLDPGGFVLRGTVSDPEFAGLCEAAEVVVVPSYAEGYSIPVVQALQRGTPVVASDIPAHRELVGDGAWLADPADARAIAAALAFVRANREQALAEQRSKLGDRADADVARTGLERPLAELLANARPPAPTRARRARPRIAVVSPFPPQASGVADYTEYTFSHVARHADVDVYSAAAAPDRDGVHAISGRPFLDAGYDAVVHVIGNSHFHFPMLDLLGEYGGAVVAHDNRMFEAYRLDRGDIWTAKMVSSADRAVAPEELDRLVRELDDLPAIGYLDVARRATPLIVHGPALAERIAVETGVRPRVVSFVPYKVPQDGVLTADRRRTAREELGLGDERLHIASFGIVDGRTKATDRIVGAVAWLRTWGLSPHLHIVGECPAHERRPLELLARELEVSDAVTFYGRVTPEVLETFHLGVDVAVQLRTSALLSLSGALADCIAYGIPTVTTRELAEEMGAPFYVATTSSKTSSLLVAEAIAGIGSMRRDRPDDIDGARRDYLRARSPDAYARGLLDALGLSPA